jgi:hypothetical protein
MRFALYRSNAELQQCNTIYALCILLTAAQQHRTTEPLPVRWNSLGVTSLRFNPLRLPPND